MEEVAALRERQRLTTVWIKDTLGPQLEKVIAILLCLLLIALHCR